MFTESISEVVEIWGCSFYVNGIDKVTRVLNAIFGSLYQTSILVKRI